MTGNPASEWDISGAGDSSIQGFATDISVNRGGTVSLKINASTSYRLDIYRMGYYGGMGARKVDTVPSSSGTLPSQTQPACLTNSATGLIDCGNWAVSASWAVPDNATSGIYFAKAISTAGGASHIFFIVRDDLSHSDILFKTSDTTWQAYNDYGGSNLYTGGPGPQGGAYKVSYNRPFHTRVYEFYSWVFNAEYPMIRFLEANGYDVSYFTGVDTDRLGSLILQHKLFLSVGHDEYWSGNERANVEAARAAGIHLAFITGNGIFWKTRWDSIDGPNAYRTMVCYKETHSNAKTDPLDPPTWTGTWRDLRFSPPADGGRPENGLQGTIFYINGPGPVEEIKVPQADGQMRFWRNTAPATLTAGATYTTSINALGYEWDIDADNGFRPAGQFVLSTATYNTSSNYLLDYGSTYGSGTATHHLVMYRYVNGGHSALVFGSGTSQWPWGLDGNHDGGSTTPDTNLQQATVNLLADMGAQPATLQGLTPTIASTDTFAPLSTITSPTPGSTLTLGSPVTISGTATDSGGVVSGVEVSVDGGTTWHPASGRASWNYTWTPNASGSVTIMSRAVDDSGNLEASSAGVIVSVSGSGSSCTGGCTTIWLSTVAPVVADSGPDSAVEVGVKFSSDTAGTITGIRFYKTGTNTGTHVGNLWTGTGTLLKSATFTGETASGWQQVNFTPVAIAANTVYVASYHANVGHYSEDDNYFSVNGVDSPPLHALANGASGANGVYAYGSTSAFPNQTFNSANYWVDMVFNSGGAVPTLSSIAVTPVNPTISPGATQQFTATGTYSDNSTQNVTSQVTWTSSNTGVATINVSGLAAAVGPGQTTISAALSGFSNGTTLTVQAAPLAITTTSLPNGTVNMAYSATLTASGGTMPYTWSIASGSLPPPLTLNFTSGAITGTPTAAGTSNFTAQVSDASNPVQTVTKPLSITISAVPTVATIWPSTTTPAVAADSDTSAIELGVKFKADVNGQITGIRFYKGSGNTGTHTGTLWSSTKTKLATATFTSETGSGWQQVTFTTPVAITANTVYVASYHTNVGHYSEDDNYFSGKGVDSPPLHALQNGVSGPNGVYRYGSSSGFPTNTYQSSNYWVDVVFKPSAP